MVDWAFTATWSVTDPLKLSGTWTPIRWSPVLDVHPRVDQPFLLQFVREMVKEDKDKSISADVDVNPKKDIKNVFFEVPPSGVYRGTFWTGETPKDLGNPRQIKTTELELKLNFSYGEMESNTEGNIVGYVDEYGKSGDSSVPALSAGGVVGVIQRKCRRLRCQVFPPLREGKSDTRRITTTTTATVPSSRTNPRSRKKRAAKRKMTNLA
eukprot:g5155.t1